MHTPASATAVRWRILGLLMLYAGFGHFNRMSMAVAGTEQLIPQYGIDPTVMGTVYSAFLLAYAIAMVPGGWFIDRAGPRIALATMGFGGALMAALTGASALFGPSLLLIALWIIRPIAGVLNAPLHPGAARTVSLWFPAHARSAANGMVSAGALIGIALVPIVFGAMIDAVGWPMAFVISGSVTALLALAWTVFARDRPSQHPDANAAEAALVESEPEPAASATPPAAVTARSRSYTSLIFLTLSYAAVGYVQYLFFYWLEFYLKDVLHVEVGLSRIYTTIASLSMAVGMAAGGLLADRATHRLGPRKGRALVPVVGLLASAALVAMGALTQDVILVVILFSLAMAAVGATEGPSWSTATDIGGRKAGLAASIVNTGGNVGGLLAPVITPLFARYFGWQASIGLAAVFSILGAITWAGIDPSQTMDGDRK